MSPKRPTPKKTATKSSQATPPGRSQGRRDNARTNGDHVERAVTPKQPKQGPRVDPNDPVEEASWESFPASDPPSFNPAPRSKAAPANDDEDVDRN